MEEEMTSYLEDVCTQAVELRNMLDWYIKTGMLKQMNKLREIPFRKVVFSGMGSSHYCAASAGIYLKQHGVENHVISTGVLLY